MRSETLSRRAVMRWGLAIPAALSGLFGGRASGSAGSSCAATGADVQGPFYLPGAPRRAVLAGPNEPGDRVAISGTVFAGDCKTPLAGALLDIWHADAAGNYHNEKEQYRLRGQALTDAKGRYRFESVRPGNYAISENSMRPAHFHFTATAPGHEPLTSQIYFKGDPHLAPHDACDECHSDDPRRIVELAREDRAGKPHWSGRFDIVLKAAEA